MEDTQPQVEHSPRVTVWANGFGLWHVRVPRTVVSPIIAARQALRDELTARHNNVADYVWKHPVLMPELSDADTVVYTEGLVPGTPAPAAEADTASDFEEHFDNEIGELFANYTLDGQSQPQTAVRVVALLMLWAHRSGEIDPRALLDLAEADYLALSSPPPPLRGVGECARCGAVVELRPLDPAAPKVNEWLDERGVDGCGDTVESHAPDPAGLVTVSLRIGNHYELHESVVTECTDVLVPRPDGGSEWAVTWLLPFTGVGHLGGESFYVVEVTASSVPELVGMRVEF